MVSCQLGITKIFLYIMDVLCHTVTDTSTRLHDIFAAKGDQDMDNFVYLLVHSGGSLDYTTTTCTGLLQWQGVLQPSQTNLGIRRQHRTCT